MRQRIARELCFLEMPVKTLNKNYNSLTTPKKKNRNNNNNQKKTNKKNLQVPIFTTSMNHSINKNMSMGFPIFFKWPLVLNIPNLKLVILYLHVLHLLISSFLKYLFLEVIWEMIVVRITNVASPKITLKCGNWTSITTSGVVFNQLQRKQNVRRLTKFHMIEGKLTKH